MDRSEANTGLTIRGIKPGEDPIGQFLEVRVAELEERNDELGAALREVRKEPAKLSAKLEKANERLSYLRTSLKRTEDSQKDPFARKLAEGGGWSVHAARKLKPEELFGRIALTAAAAVRGVRAVDGNGIRYARSEMVGAAACLRAWWYDLRPAAEEEAEAGRIRDQRSVISLNITGTAYRILINLGYKELADLALKDEQTVAGVNGLGKKSLQSIKDGLAKRGLRFGMTQEEVDAVLGKEG